MWNDLPSCTISSKGIIRVQLRHNVTVDVSPDGAVKIFNGNQGILMALDAPGSSSALMHPNGRMYQSGACIEVKAHNVDNSNIYAKMYHKGVTFTNDKCALTYLIDAAGTRSTKDSFSKLTHDICLEVFCSRATFHYSQMFDYANAVMNNSMAWVAVDGSENWMINKIKICQTVAGMVSINRNNSEFFMRTSPFTGSATISTPFVYCTGSLRQSRHLFVRHDGRRLYYDGARFIVSVLRQSAGFNKFHEFTLY